VNTLGNSAYLQRQHQVCDCPPQAVSESSSFFNGITKIVGKLPVYGWVLIGVGGFLIVVAVVYLVFKFNTKKIVEESV